MDNVCGKVSSAADGRVASVGTDLHFERGYGGRPRQVFSGALEVLAAILR